MGRPPLPIGAWGEIYYKQLPTGQWMARASLRYADGEVRPIKRHGQTKAKAKAKLLDALAEARGDALSGQISKSTRLDELADVFFAEQERLAAQSAGVAALSRAARDSRIRYRSRADLWRTAQHARVQGHADRPARHNVRRARTGPRRHARQQQCA